MNRMKLTRSILVALAIVLASALANAQPEAGPENGGLRLRWLVSPQQEAKGYDVRLELLNVSSQDVVLRARWPRDLDKGSVKDYIESATSIETYPAIAPWVGQMIDAKRTTPQAEQVLKSGEALTMRWRTDKPRLKHKVVYSHSVQNPELVVPGLYAAHAVLRIDAGGADVLLRSNEQLVSVGGSRGLPKHTYGHLSFVDMKAKTARLDLGKLHKIWVGNRFKIVTGIGAYWRLTITESQPEYSVGRLEPMSNPGVRAEVPPPGNGMGATLILSK